MNPKETDPNLESIHKEVDTRERGWIETTTLYEYLLDRSTGQVTLVETVDVDNPYPKGKSCKDKEVCRTVLTPTQVPPEIREKIKALMERK